MKRAIIDLGTNTFNLLIGTIEGENLDIVYSTKEAVMLGMGGINHGYIAEDALRRAKETLTHFKEESERHGVSDIIGLATSAMRGARNAQDLIDWAKTTHNIDIRIISGATEANLIYTGVSLLHDFQEGTMIMDIGGGSNEFIHANADGVLASKSFNIGVSRVYQMLGEPEMLSLELQSKVNQFFESETAGFFNNLEVDHLIGASGSFETFYEMQFKERFSNDRQLKELPIEDLKSLIEWSLHASLEERMSNEWIVPMRKKMLPVAAYSILWVLDKLKTKTVSVCPYSLKEGAFTL